jgi:tyrosyl-tRNA synthetase
MKGGSMDFVEELTWRGMIHDIMPGTQERLLEKPSAGYVGFDPTAPSLQIGNFATIMLLVHFQRAGHKPLALVGGATGMIGDPSGKSEERKLLTLDEIQYNLGRFKVQLSKFLDFGSGPSGAEIVNNYDWFKNMGFLEFLRDAGKHLSVNYMLAKDSVQSRLATGISFTEFSYQLLQGYDFYWLFKNKGCAVQMGGSDQWGNITAGCELIRRKAQGDAFALTCPLITKADGTKFGKSEAGEKIWLDPAMTSPYKFYQFWLNVSDDEALRYLKVFSVLSAEEIESIHAAHASAPHARALQKALAREITVRVHSEADYKTAVESSQILFGDGATEALKRLSENDLLSMFEGIPQFTIAKSEIERGIGLIDLLAGKTSIIASKGEAKRLIQNGGVFINKAKADDGAQTIGAADLIGNRYIVIQKGKKNYFLVKAA